LTEYNTGVSGRFTILNPCTKRWSDLNGDVRKRFCDECQTYVHDLDLYSSREIEDLRRNSSRRVCGLLTGESIPEPRSRRAVLVGALLTAVSPLMAQSGRVRIHVTDSTGAIIPNAAAALPGENGSPLRTAKSNEAGEIIFVDLPIGDLRLTVSAPGFNRLPLTVTSRTSHEVKVDAKLQVYFMGEVVLIKPKRR
jgi:Carboxypeptidase regulatory-like domain